MKTSKDNDWIKLSDQLPDPKIVGDKVLLHRISTKPQASQAISIINTKMVKYCDPDETHWMILPKSPK